MSVQPSVLVLSGAPGPIVLSKLVETSTRFGLPESERFIDADNDMAAGGIALFKSADFPFKSLSRLAGAKEPVLLWPDD